MGFEKGSISFRRYEISGWKHGVIDDAMLGALSANAFGRYPAAVDGTEMGWVTPVHLFDLDFAAEKIDFGRFAYLRLRVDRNTVPGAILSSYVAIEEMTEREAAGTDTLTKKQRAQARQTAKTRADQEARSGAFRRISVYPILIDLENAMLYVGHAGNQVNERVCGVFTETFDVRLEPVTAHTLAATTAEKSGAQRTLEDAAPCHWITPPDGVDGDAFGPDAADRSFLGREFLTWLWHRTDAGEGLVECAGGDDLSLSVARRIQLRCDFNLTGSTTVCADGPAELPETRVALAAGKQPSRMGLIVASGAGQWSFSLGAERLDVTGMTTESDDADNPHDRLARRLAATADLGDTIDRLFTAFVSLRLSSQWSPARERMTEWAAAHRLGPRPAAPRLVRA